MTIFTTKSLVFCLLNIHNVCSHSSTHYIYSYDTSELYESEVLKLIENTHITYVKSDEYKRCYYRFNPNSVNYDITINIIDGVKTLNYSNDTDINSLIYFHCQIYSQEKQQMVIFISPFVLLVLIYVWCICCISNNSRNQLY